MAKVLKPGENPGEDGGIFQEVGPRGGLKDNFATIPDGHKAPPTQEPGHSWKQVQRTPDGSRK